MENHESYYQKVLKKLVSTAFDLEYSSSNTDDL